MIKTLTGTVTKKEAGLVVITVNDIGYLVHVLDTWNHSDTTTLWTHLAVRENSLDLYGFSSAYECDLFESLLTIPKIGPKSALQILNKASPELLIQAIREKDPSGLAKRSGIGQKTAEKLVQELQNRTSIEGVVRVESPTPNNDEAIATLIALGYPERTAYDTVRSVLQEQKEDLDTQTIIRAALQRLSTH